MARTAIFRVYLSRPSVETITVGYTTVPGSAVSPSDFTPVSGTLSFSPGQTVAQIAVPVRNDIPGSAEEKFSVALSSPTKATIQRDTAFCTLPGAAIDSQPVAYIDNITVPSA
ncbi:Calx-beta domain-containing protein [Methylosinus sp. PW1]|uniref:Calx-beta domain-containing protein n=1 Tax=Methylosinus sp. PW1 TaxID=107636 RepID=UPI000563604D|nr:Calx-beta domain-containing protein [Methylosinus sp. PW1]